MNASNVIFRGKKLQVEWYEKANGEMPGKEYLEGQRSQVAEKLLAWIVLLANEGRLYDVTKFRIVDKENKIYEFKPLDHRFFSFFIEGGKVIITHGYRKQTQKADPKEVRRAVRIKEAYLAQGRGK